MARAQISPLTELRLHSAQVGLGAVAEYLAARLLPPRVSARERAELRELLGIVETANEIIGDARKEINETLGKENS